MSNRETSATHMNIRGWWQYSGSLTIFHFLRASKCNITPHAVPLDLERANLAVLVMGSSRILNGCLPIENIMVPSSRLHRRKFQDGVFQFDFVLSSNILKPWRAEVWSYLPMSVTVILVLKSPLCFVVLLFWHNGTISLNHVIFYLDYDKDNRSWT